METKATDKKGGKDWNKTRKILSYVCCALLIGLALWQFMGNKQTASGTVQDGTLQGADSQTQAGSPVTETASTAGSPQLAVFDDEEVSPSSPALEAAEPVAPETAEPTAPSTASQAPAPAPGTAAKPAQSAEIAEDGLYTSKEDVALYIHTYGHLPGNFISKAEAKELGWGDRYGSVDEAAPGKSIGGDRFGNREGLLPKKKGRTYTECDIGTMGKKSRGAKRIVFSNDGLVYYTGDHYETFELLYGIPD